ncbi:MAG: hypothetical protein IOD12_18395 [Silvanigrellales bacterium]|nr:hypothetical protein [Silvanigrellales bacterium]
MERSQNCAYDPSHLAGLDVLVTDFNFAQNDPEDGASFAKSLRGRGDRCLILLASGESFLGDEIESLFDEEADPNGRRSSYTRSVEWMLCQQRHFVTRARSEPAISSSQW